MINQKLQNDILTILAAGSRFHNDATGETFEAVTETDLVEGLRARGWRLPATGFFLSEVQAEGFTTRQGYQFSGKVRRAFRDGRTGRALSKYQTIIFI